MPVEATENVAPIVIWRKELREGSAGAGRTRGGLGQTMEISTKGELEFAVNATFDRIANAPKGRDGGGLGANGAVHLKSGERLRTKGYQVIPNGNRLILQMPGGGGMGDPATREPFRHVNYLHDIAVESIVGRGAHGYHLALESIARRFGGVGG